MWIPVPFTVFVVVAIVGAGIWLADRPAAVRKRQQQQEDRRRLRDDLTDPERPSPGELPYGFRSDGH